MGRQLEKHAGRRTGWTARRIGLDSLCRILSSLSGANIGHQNSLRPSALDKEQSKVEEGTVSKLNSVLLFATCGKLWPFYEIFVQKYSLNLDTDKHCIRAGGA